jgi:hypothetical protein
LALVGRWEIIINMNIFKKLINILNSTSFYLISVIILVFVNSGLQKTLVLGLTNKDIQSIVRRTEWYDPEQECSSGGVAEPSLTNQLPATVNPFGLTYSDRSVVNDGRILLFPNVTNEDKVISAIDQYINNNAPDSSPFRESGMASEIFQGSKTAGINPFNVVMHAQLESSFGTEGIATKGSFNAFGAKASSNAPDSEVYIGEDGTRHTKWPSWKASVNSENGIQYRMKATYIDGVRADGKFKGLVEMENYLYIYAPPVDGDDDYLNPSAEYLNSFKSGVEEMISSSGDGLGDPITVTVNSINPEEAKKRDYKEELFKKNNPAYQHKRILVDPETGELLKELPDDEAGIGNAFNNTAQSPKVSSLAELEGNKIPALKGGSGPEEKAIRSGNKVILERTREQLTFSPPDVTDKDIEFYGNMRWGYVKWAWSGKSEPGGTTGTYSWMQQKTRKLLVTNPTNGRSIVVAAIEAGPAPFAGSSSGESAPPYWSGYIEGTPAEYDGRVSGLSPAAWEALGAKQTVDGKGDILEYGWASDQSLQSGTVFENGEVSTEQNSDSCPGATVGPANIKKKVPAPFTGNIMDNVTGIVLHYTAGPADSTVDEFVGQIQSNKACGPKGCSVQFYVSGNGDIWQLVEPINTLTEHAAGSNSCCIGIEIGGMNEQELLANEVQKKAVVSLVVHLKAMFNIQDQPMSLGNRGVLSHHITLGGLLRKPDVGNTYHEQILAAVGSSGAGGGGGSLSDCPPGVKQGAQYIEFCPQLKQLLDGPNKKDIQNLKDQALSAGTLLPESGASDIGITRISSSIKDELQQMIDAAKSEGLTLEPVSGYRSFEEQALQRIKFCSDNLTDLSFERIFKGGTATCTTSVRNPGTSNHNKGLAMDFGRNGVTDDKAFEAYPEFTWLKSNASKFGLKNLPGEPWHWSIDGK